MLGCGLPGGEQGFNMARVVAVLLGYDTLPGTTVNRYCSSSLQTTRMAMHAIRAGEGDVFISAGVETVSRFAQGNSDSLARHPQPDLRRRRGPRRAHIAENGADDWSDPRDDEHLPDIYIAMGQTAENVARLKGVTREDMDEFGVRSQNLAEKAIANGFFAREITPVTLPGRHGRQRRRRAARGGHLRGGQPAQAGVPARRPGHRGQLLPAQRRRRRGGRHVRHEGGRAGHHAARARGLHGRVRLSPEIMGLGPVEASKQALARAGMTIDDIDLVEINEAFAAQVLPSARDLGIDVEKLNVNGGAIALGHPFGMTGARIITTLLNGLRTHDKTIGLETMCVGGGQGMAMVLERLS